MVDIAGRRGGRWLQRVGRRRLASMVVVLVAATLVAGLSWHVPVLVDAERTLFDIRTAFAAPRVDQDGRIAIITYTESTLQHTARRSPVDRALLARALTALDHAGAKAIGVDILIDQAVAGEDEVLTAALRAMHTPVRLAFASVKDTAEFIEPWQETHLLGFIGQAGPRVSAGSVRLEADADGTVRRWPALVSGVPPLSRALAASPEIYRGMIAYRQAKLTDRPVFNKLDIELLADPATATMLAPLLRGRIVLIGADLPSTDRLPTPFTAITGATMAGTEIHAHMLAQTLDRDWPAPIPGWLVWLAALAAVAAGATTSLVEKKLTWLVVLIGVQAATLLGVPLLLAATHTIDTTGFPALGWALGWLGAFIAVGSAARSIGSEERRFAQGALGKYLPEDVAAMILREPERLALSGESREIFALFSDMEGFTKLCHRLSPEEVATFLNDYLDHLCTIVLRHGGTIDKFVGDAVVAFWGAPVSRPGDGDRALAAAAEMCRAVELKVSGDTPLIGKTRVGLHWGRTVVGNFGGSGRMQYTALGDTMNTAARMESANKYLRTSALVSGDALAGMATAAVRPMGRVLLRGRAAAIDVYEPTDDLDHARDLRSLYWAFRMGDADALTQMRIVAEARPNDHALAYLVHRLTESGPEGATILE